MAPRKPPPLVGIAIGIPISLALWGIVTAILWVTAKVAAMLPS